MLEVRGLTKSMTVNLTENPQVWPMTIEMTIGLSGLLFLQALRNKIRLKKTDTTALRENRGIKQNTIPELWSPMVKDNRTMQAQ